MIPRLIHPQLIDALSNSPVVALLGPRQVGKTTLSLQLGRTWKVKKSAYLDLELDSDLAKLDDPESYLRRFENQLLIIDEVQRKPDLFRVLRGLVDMRKRNGEPSGQFLLLGSASRDLLQQSSESLAGRIQFLEMTPFSIAELAVSEKNNFNLQQHWFRGGYPDSYLANSDEQSWQWLGNFISTYIERDIPLLGVQIPPARMRRFWTMISHFHGQQVNLSSLGKSLDVSHTTARSYVDVLTDLYMLRQLPPWSGNTKKRLVKSPKIYLRDSGILHRILNIADFETLLGNPLLGHSWEGFVIESILNSLSDKWRFSYYRTTAQTEIDLVLEGPRRQVWAIEVKYTLAPKLGAGFHRACEDINASKKWVIYSGEERYPMAENTEVIGVIDFLAALQS